MTAIVNGKSRILKSGGQIRAVETHSDPEAEPLARLRGQAPRKWGCRAQPQKMNSSAYLIVNIASNFPHIATGCPGLICHT